MKPYIVVCAKGRGVVFGWTDAEPVIGQSVKLTGARMIMYWAGTDGLFGLAANGPHKDSRITHAVTTATSPCTEFIECTDKAAEALDGWGS